MGELARDLGPVGVLFGDRLWPVDAHMTAAPMSGTMWLIGGVRRGISGTKFGWWTFVGPGTLSWDVGWRLRPGVRAVSASINIDGVISGNGPAPLRLLRPQTNSGQAGTRTVSPFPPSRSCHGPPTCFRMAGEGGSDRSFERPAGKLSWSSATLAEAGCSATRRFPAVHGAAVGAGIWKA